MSLQLTQVIHPNLAIVQDIINQSAKDAGITKEIKKDIEIANLLAVSELDDAYKRTAQTIYERRSTKNLIQIIVYNLDHFLHQGNHFLEALC